MTHHATPIGPLLQTVFESILEVFLLCLAGYVLAKKGILDRPTQKKLNRLNVSLFTPSLLFSKVAFFLSPSKLRELWVIPVFFVVTTTVSMTAAFVLGWIFRLKKSQRSFAVAAAMFMNSNSLPIALMQSLVVTVPGLKWGDDDNSDAMIGRALTYLVLYSTMGMVLRWSYGVRLLTQADPEVTSGSVQVHPPESPLLDREETGFLPSTDEYRALQHNQPHSTEPLETDRLNADPKVFYSFPNSPSGRAKQLPSSSTSTSAPSTEVSDDEDEALEFPGRRPRTEPTSSAWQSCLRKTRRRLDKYVRAILDFMTVPLWAALLSLIVALIPILQHTLDEHVAPIRGALTEAGNCSIPLTLVVLGAYFYVPPDAEDVRSRAVALPTHGPRSRSVSTNWSQLSLVDSVREMFKLKAKGHSPSREGEAGKKSTRPGETKTVIIAILSRMIITPMLLLPMFALSTRLSVHEMFDDPVFVVSNVLLIASPPALTLAQITQTASGDAFERLISRTIFWSYCVVTPPSAILFVVIGMIVSKL